jgi:hypothetical protein
VRLAVTLLPAQGSPNEGQMSPEEHGSWVSEEAISHLFEVEAKKEWKQNPKFDSASDAGNFFAF